MLIEINGHGVELTDKLYAHVEERINHSLAHLKDRITRVEAHLGDQNGSKGGDSDKRCMLEARPKGMDPIAVTDEDGDMFNAVSQAAAKLHRALETRFGKLDA